MKLLEKIFGCFHRWGMWKRENFMANYSDVRPIEITANVRVCEKCNKNEVARMR